MSVGCHVKKVRLSSGERLPLLVHSDSGIPLWNPAIFVMTELRASNCASLTLLQATRAIMVGHQVLVHLAIDIEERINQGRMFELQELDALVNLVGLEQKALDQLAAEPSSPVQKRRQPTSIEKARMRSKAGQQRSVVAPGTKAIRLLYFRDYLQWLAKRKLLSLDHTDPRHRTLSDTVSEFVDRINTRIPPTKNQDIYEAREGLDPKIERRIREVVNPNSPENPWKNNHVRTRNHLVIELLLALGLRRGELLGVKLTDIDFRSSHLLIRRRADDPEDLRRDEPATKTRSRLLVISSELAELMRAYIHGTRRANKGSRRHPFLIVANGTGTPLTTSGLSKIFDELRDRVPDLPNDLSPHVLRHTWNERFSELMDERGVAPEEEEKLRRQQMGWSDKSKMSAVYTRRHVRKKADEASLAHQSKIYRADTGQK